MGDESGVVKAVGDDGGLGGGVHFHLNGAEKSKFVETAEVACDGRRGKGLAGAYFKLGADQLLADLFEPEEPYGVYTQVGGSALRVRGGSKYERRYKN